MEQDDVALVDIAGGEARKGGGRRHHELGDAEGQGAHDICRHERPGRAADGDYRVEPVFR